MPYTDSFRGSRALITGGLGFIGTNLARRLVALGAKVTLIDSLIPEYGGNLFNIARHRATASGQHRRRARPARRRHLVRGQRLPLQPRRPDQPRRLDDRSVTDLEINCRASSRCSRPAGSTIRRCGIVFASTRQLYGRPQYLPVDESTRSARSTSTASTSSPASSYHLLYNDVYGIRASRCGSPTPTAPAMLVEHNRQTASSPGSSSKAVDGERDPDLGRRPATAHARAARTSRRAPRRSRGDCRSSPPPCRRTRWRSADRPRGRSARRTP